MRKAPAECTTATGHWRPTWRLLAAALATALCALLLGSVTWRSPAHGQELPEQPSLPVAGEFLFGADFNPQATETVRSLFYESGMNCVRLTGGGYNWSLAMHKKLADEFQARGLKVYLQLGSHYPSADYFPRKEAWMVDQAGQTGVEDRNAWAINYSGNCWPQYSYGTEAFRRQLEGDFAAYLRPFAANTNVAGVILHNEPGFFWMTDRVFDYNPATIAKFRIWLQQQHGSIQTLNARWGSRFASFDQVTPPGKPPAQRVGAWLDWRRFQVALISDFLSWESSFFKQQLPAVARTTNLAGPLDHWFGYRCAQNDAHSAMMDRAGIDLYPTPWTDRVFLPYSMDMTQGVAQGRPAHVLECDVFSPKLWKDYSEEQRADLLRGELWTLIGHGARGVLLWGFSRDDEFSLTDGQYTRRLQACRDIAHLTGMLRIGDFARPRPQVALCVDPDSYLYAAAVEAKPHELTPGEDADAHGLYAALADAHVAAEVILTPQLRTGAWRNYRAIVLAGARLMDEQTASQLEQFVSGGGLLIADAPLAEMDHWGNTPKDLPGAGMDRLFGVRYTRTQSPGGWFAIGSAEGKITASSVRADLQLTGAQALGALEDGTPGLTSHTYGKGRAILLNGRVGIPYINSDSPALRRWMKATIGALAAGPQVQLSPATAEVLDSSSLQDARGNLLVVVTALGSKGKLPAAQDQVQLSIRSDQPEAFTGAFLLPPSEVRGSVVSSGPERLETVLIDSGRRVSLAIGPITSAMPLLLTRDAGPLLRIEAPAQAQRGDEIVVRVTCHNPSPRAFQGHLRLRVVTGAVETGQSAAVAVEPLAQQVLQLPLRIPGTLSPGRLAVTAVLTSLAEAPEVVGVPVDLQVK